MYRYKLVYASPDKSKKLQSEGPCVPVGLILQVHFLSRIKD